MQYEGLNLKKRRDRATLYGRIATECRHDPNRAVILGHGICIYLKIFKIAKTKHDILLFKEILAGQIERRSIYLFPYGDSASRISWLYETRRKIMSYPRYLPEFLFPIYERYFYKPSK